MRVYKLLKGYLFPKLEVDYSNIQPMPSDHIIVNVSATIYNPYTFDMVRIVYHKHRDINIDRIHKFYISQGHPLWNWQNQN